MQETWVQSLGWEDSLGVGNDNPLQNSCLGNPTDRGTTVHGIAESDTTEGPTLPASTMLCGPRDLSYLPGIEPESLAARLPCPNLWITGEFPPISHL